MSNHGSKNTHRDEFLEAMSRVASAVSVVTTDGKAGCFGATVSSLVSVSAETQRPTVLVCLQKSAGVARAMLKNGNFGVSLLSKDQAEIADLFAGRRGRRGQDRFSVDGWERGATGAPRLLESLVSLDCNVSQASLVGQHYVVFGEVHAISIGEGQPLIYASRSYASLDQSRQNHELTAA